RAKKVTEVLRCVRDELDRTRHLQMQEAVQRVNRIVMGWVNYFRVANSSRALQLVKDACSYCTSYAKTACARWNGPDARGVFCCFSYAGIVLRVFIDKLVLVIDAASTEQIALAPAFDRSTGDIVPLR